MIFGVYENQSKRLSVSISGVCLEFINTCSQHEPVKQQQNAETRNMVVDCCIETRTQPATRTGVPSRPWDGRAVIVPNTAHI